MELIRGALELVEELDLVREAGGGMEAAESWIWFSQASGKGSR